jgi:hypothetical protein
MAPAGALGGAAPAGTGTPGTTLLAGPAAAAARTFSGVVRGTGRDVCTACTPAVRAAAWLLTRCSCSAARSGARPAHSRNRFISRACANTSNARMAMPSSAAKAAIAPILVIEFVSDSASGE